MTGPARMRSLLGATALVSSLVALRQPALAQAANGTVELETIEVQGTARRPIDTPEGTTGYVVTRERAGTKTDTPAVAVPQSSTTVTRQELNDRDVQTLGQALNYTPGVTTGAFGYDPRFDSFFVRGFDVTYTGLYRDGLRLGGGTFSIPKTEPYGLQSITVLRGPASGLYGLGSPGGIVDSVTKRPPHHRSANSSSSSAATTGVRSTSTSAAPSPATTSSPIASPACCGTPTRSSRAARTTGPTSPLR